MDRINQYLKLSSALKEHDEPILPLASPIAPSPFKIAPAVTPPDSPQPPQTPHTPVTPRSKRHSHRRSFFTPTIGSSPEIPQSADMSNAQIQQPPKNWFVPSASPSHVNAPPTPQTPKRASWHMPRPDASQIETSASRHKSLYISPAIPPPTIEEALSAASEKTWEPFANVIFPGETTYAAYPGLGLSPSRIRDAEKEFTFSMLAQDVQTAATTTVSLAAAAGRIDVSMSALATDTVSFVCRMLRAWDNRSGTPRDLFDTLMAQVLEPIPVEMKPRDFDAWFTDLALLAVNALALNGVLLKSAEAAAGNLNQVTFFGNRAVEGGDQFQATETASTMSPRNKRESWWAM